MFNRLLSGAFFWVFHNIYQNAYSNEINEAQRATLTAAKNSDFAADDFTYYYTEGVGPDPSNPDGRLYVIRAKKVDPDNLHEEARIFGERVRSGNAFLNNTVTVTTTTAAATTTTAAPTTTTTTV